MQLNGEWNTIYRICIAYVYKEDEISELVEEDEISELVELVE